MAKTVPMVRDADGKTADVHPDEVANMRAAGWSEASRKPRAKRQKAAD